MKSIAKATFFYLCIFYLWFFMYSGNVSENSSGTIVSTETIPAKITQLKRHKTNTGIPHEYKVKVTAYSKKYDVTYSDVFSETGMDRPDYWDAKIGDKVQLWVQIERDPVSDNILSIEVIDFY